jgi:hypothetical protein
MSSTRQTPNNSLRTGRGDHSDSGDAWSYFSHDQARSRAYRWVLTIGRRPPPVRERPAHALSARS